MNADEMLKYLLGLKEQDYDLTKIGFVTDIDGFKALYPGSLHRTDNNEQAILLPWQPLPADRYLHPIE